MRASSWTVRRAGLTRSTLTAPDGSARGCGNLPGHPPTASRMELPMAPAPANSKNADRMDTIVSLSKRRGFVFPSSEIYGGLRASWDYGPLGVELKNNIKRQWWRSMVQGRDAIDGPDSCGIPAREVWE